MCFLVSRIGEGRACWSLGNAHTALGNHDQAMHFAEKHLEICKEVTAKKKIPWTCFNAGLYNVAVNASQVLFVVLTC